MIIVSSTFLTIQILLLGFYSKKSDCVPWLFSDHYYQFMYSSWSRWQLGDIKWGVSFKIPRLLSWIYNKVFRCSLHLSNFLHWAFFYSCVMNHNFARAKEWVTKWWLWRHPSLGYTCLTQCDRSFVTFLVREVHFFYSNYSQTSKSERTRNHCIFEEDLTPRDSVQ